MRGRRVASVCTEAFFSGAAGLQTDGGQRRTGLDVMGFPRAAGWKPGSMRY